MSLTDLVGFISENTLVAPNENDTAVGDNIPFVHLMVKKAYRIIHLLSAIRIKIISQPLTSAQIASHSCTGPTASFTVDFGNVKMDSIPLIHHTSDLLCLHCKANSHLPIHYTTHHSLQPTDFIFILQVYPFPKHIAKHHAFSQTVSHK